MPKHILSSRKRVGFIAISTAVLFCTLCCSFYFAHPARRFRHTAERLFYDEMTSSTLNMHYTLAHPEHYGIKDYEPLLPCYDSADQNDSINSLQNLVNVLKKLDATKLSAQNAHTLTLLLSYLDNILALNQYPYYEEPLSPSSGMQSQLLILLAEYPFRNIRDIEDYLAILSQTGAYFSSLLTFEKEKKEEGLLMAASSLRKTAKQCKTILNADSLQNGQHFLQITFHERLEELYDKHLLDDSLMQKYLSQNNEILANILLPAYSDLADGLLELADETILLKGLSAQPEGAQYYEILLHSETGSSLDIKELTHILNDQLDSEFSQLCTMLQNTAPFYLTEEAAQICSNNFPLQDCTDMLTDLRNRMSGQFPAFPNSANITPSVHIKEVTSCLQDYCAPAFYLTPPLDESIQNSIYINTQTAASKIDLYTTLAHEGFPGHLYQTVYSNQLQLQTAEPPLLQLIWFGGYLEGWALYVEFMAYDYAAQIMQESGYPDYASLIKIEKHNRATQLCLYSLLDILIHHENADLAQTTELLAQFGITNSTSANAIYEYIVEEPANYPKYYVGYLEILMLKDLCREVWGEQYSDLAFHKFYLDNGPADFKTLQDLAMIYTP